MCGAMDVVLKALHHRYSDIKYPDFDTLVKVASLIEQYKLHQPLYHVAKSFYDPWLAEKPVMTGNWCLLAWTFGLEKQFQEATSNLSKSVIGTLGKEGELQMDNGKRMSPDIPEVIVCKSTPLYSIWLTINF